MPSKPSIFMYLLKFHYRYLIWQCKKALIIDLTIVWFMMKQVSQHLNLKRYCILAVL